MTLAKCAQFSNKQSRGDFAKVCAFRYSAVLDIDKLLLIAFPDERENF